jgi:hypothetical protein
MSQLESRTKPLLLALGNCDRAVRDLSHTEQTTLARWATKTAFVLHSAEGFVYHMIPSEAYPELRESVVDSQAKVARVPCLTYDYTGQQRQADDTG